MKMQTAMRGALRDAFKGTTLKKLYPKRYLAAVSGKPVKKGRVVFLEVRGKGLSDNFRLIRTALERRNEKLSSAQRKSGKGEPILAGDSSGSGMRGRVPYSFTTICIREGMDNPAAVARNCLNAIPHLAEAEFIFVSESSYFLSSLPIRKETTVIQTWHACGAFKKFGYSAVGKGFGTTLKDLEEYPVHRNFSYVTVSSPEVVWAYAEAFHMEDRKECILPVGVSRTDMFFSRKFREKACGKVSWVLRRMAPELFLQGSTQGHSSQRELYAKLGDVYSDQYKGENSAAEPEIVPGRKIILYAPTFRGTVGHASSPDRLDIAMMKREVGDRYILLINHHPFVKEKDRPKIPESCRDFAFDMTDHLSVEELLTAADVCITDYSSLIFEYSLFERPMLFFTYDMQDYLDERGFYYPIREMMPGPVCSTTQELTEALKTPDAEFDLARVREFKYRFMSGCDGHATARVLGLMDKVSEHVAFKALKCYNP